MSLAQRITRPVVIYHRQSSGEIDEAGDAVDTETAIETRASLEPRSTTERPTHPDIAESDWLGWFQPADLAYLNAASSVWAPELGEYEVLGQPAHWDHPQAGFIEANLKRVAGPEDDTTS